MPGYRYRIAYIPREIIREMLQGLSETDGASAYFNRFVVRDDALFRRLLLAFRLFDRNPPDLLRSQLLFFQAIASLFRRYAQPKYTPCLAKAQPDVIRRACEFMDARAASNISLGDIASVVGMSRFHFLRVFKSTTGLSPYSHLLQRRIELAKTLIKKGHSLAQAALKSGFSDQSHMTRRFKAAYGMTPGQYRQAHCEMTQ